MWLWCEPVYIPGNAERVGKLAVNVCESAVRGCKFALFELKVCGLVVIVFDIAAQERELVGPVCEVVVTLCDFVVICVRMRVRVLKLLFVIAR